MTVTKTRLAHGQWEGMITDVPEGIRPGIAVRVRDTALEDVTITQVDDTQWRLSFAIPAAVINDGIQTITIVEQKTGDVLNSAAIIAGETADETMLAEIDLLKAELELLKRAFRRHCVETA